MRPETATHPDHASSTVGATALKDLRHSVVNGELQTDQVDVGLLDYRKYLERRSSTLLNNPEADLDEELEIKKYFKRQRPEYVNEIFQYAVQGEPMSMSCRAVVTIVAYSEGKSIKHTLEQYVQQDLDPALFEIVVLDNHPESVEDDETASEVARFQEEYPHINLNFYQKVWTDDEPATVGNARRYVFDIAQARLQYRGSSQSDMVFISNDADLISLESNYLSSIIGEFKDNPRTDAVVTGLTMPAEAWAKPNIAAAVMIWGTLDRVIEEDQSKTAEEDRIRETASLVGRSSAFRASTYAAIGGYNPSATMAKDTEIGWIISDARDWSADRIIRLDSTSAKSDPRRFAVAIANETPIARMHHDFQSNTSTRKLDYTDVLDHIPDEFRWEQFEQDVNMFWLGMRSGSMKRFGKKSEHIFEEAMSNMGVQYQIVDDEIVLINIDGLMGQIQSGHEIKIIHKEKRQLEPGFEQKMHEVFNLMSRGIMESWAAKVTRLREELTLAQHNNNTERVGQLERMITHYSGERS